MLLLHGLVVTRFRILLIRVVVGTDAVRINRKEKHKTAILGGKRTLNKDNKNSTKACLPLSCMQVRVNAHRHIHREDGAKDRQKDWGSVEVNHSIRHLLVQVNNNFFCDSHMVVWYNQAPTAGCFRAAPPHSVRSQPGRLITPVAAAVVPATGPQ
jgi:hypothetical protein